jgi:hypothetical protein
MKAPECENKILFLSFKKHPVSSGGGGVHVRKSLQYINTYFFKLYILELCGNLEISLVPSNSKWGFKALGVKTLLQVPQLMVG